MFVTKPKTQKHCLLLKRRGYDMNKKHFAAQEKILASVNDDELWQFAYNKMLEEYGAERVLIEHARLAFEKACDKCKNAVTIEDFMRKMRLAWLWERPPLLRGIVSGER